MPSKAQANMNRGALSPALHGRADLALWQIGMRVVHNAWVHATGGASNRSGFEYRVVSNLADRTVRLIPFIYNVDQTYHLELGHQYFRVLKDGAHVLEPGVNITGATNAAIGVFTAVAHGLAVNDYVGFAGVGGMTRVNGRFFLVRSTPTANTFTLKYLDGTAVNTSDAGVWGAYTSGGTVSRVATFETPWEEDDLPYVNFEQIGDVLRVVCLGHDEVEIARGDDHHEWTVTDPVQYGPQVAAPTNLVTSQDYGISIVEVEINETEEEVRCRVLPKRPPLRDGEKIRITGCTAVPELNDQEWLQSRSDPDGDNSDIFLCRTNGQLIDTTGWGSGAGTYDETGIISTEPVLKWRVTAENEKGEESLASAEVVRRNTTNPQETAPVIIKWTPPLLTVNGAPRTDIKRFNVYKEKNGRYGFIGRRDVEQRTPVQVTNITQANPGVMTTATPHARTQGDVIYVYEVGGMTEVNGTSWKVGAVLSPTTFEMQQMNGADLDTTVFGAFGLSPQAGMIVSDFYFEDDDIAPELEDPAPPSSVTNPFSGDGDKPRCIGLHESRIAFGGTDNDPMRMRMTRIGHFYNFEEAEPRRPDDAMDFTLASSRGATLLHMVSLRDLFLWTKDGVWQCESGDSGFSFENIRIREISKRGSAVYPGPILIDNTALYVHRNRKQVLDLAYEAAGAGYNGRNRAIYAKHFFEGKQIVSWTYQEEPERLVWIVLDDGTLVTLTYLPEEDVFGWCSHATDGFVECVSCVPEGNDDAVYIVVDRGVEWAGGRRYIERLHSREFTDARDAFFVDSGLTWDNPYDVTAIATGLIMVVTAPGHDLANGDYVDFFDVEGMTELNGNVYRVGHVNGNDLWLMEREFESGADRLITFITQASPALVTCPGHGRVDNQIIHISQVGGMRQVNGKFYKINVTDADHYELQELDGSPVDSSGWDAYTLDGRMDVGVPLTGVTFEDYVTGGAVRQAVQTVGGLDHLIGKRVNTWVNAASELGLEVDSLGRVTLSNPAGRVHVGLPYTSTLETLDAIDPGQEIAGRVRQVIGMTLRVRNTLGLTIGVDGEHQEEWQQRLFEGPHEPTAMAEGEYKLKLKPVSDRRGRVVITQTEPSPFTILGIVTEFEVK